ncbi:ShlB/FhaC/HecB family hemolysin secretion/activation protein [Azospirillum doebereinerae]
MTSSIRSVTARLLCASLTATGACGLTAIPAMGQALPNAGTLQRQLRQGVPEVVPQRPPAAPALPEATPEAGPRIVVKRFAVQGASLIPAADLEALLKDRVGREQSLRDLQDAARIVADAYRERGYFARAFLPAQDVGDGTVSIQVVEGRFGKVIRETEAARADNAYVESVVGSSLQPGQPYSVAMLERGLLLANDLPGIAADGTLKAGSAQGTSDLGLAIHDRPLLAANLGADNGGTRATGLYRGNAALAVNSLTGYGDQITVQAIRSARLSYGQAGWSVPLGPDGWRAGVTASALRYQLGGPFKDVDGRGVALTQGANLSYPLIRSTVETLRARVAYEHGRYDDDLLGSALHRKRVDKGSLALQGDRSDGWWGGGLTTYQITLTAGALDLSRLATDDALDAASARTGGHFAKLALDLQRDQGLGTEFFLRGRFAGQWTGENLDSSEQFALGGPNGVRAYPVNEGLGDSGFVANLELHRPVTEGWAAGLDLFGFVDAGFVRQHAHAWDGWNAGGDIPNAYPLFGAGVGATYAMAGDFGVSLTAAMPFGANRGSSAAGRNQDGSRTDPWVWFTATKMF